MASLQGDVNIAAGTLYQQTGSDVITPQGSVNIQAQQVLIDAARETSLDQQTTRFRQSGFTVSLSNPVAEAVQKADQMQKAASQTQDSRMKALAAMTTVLAANNAYSEVMKDPAMLGGVSLSVSVGSSRSQSQSTQSAESARGALVQAGQNISIQAQATGTQPQAASDLTVLGSSLQAGGNIALQAQGDVSLKAAQQTSSLHSSDSSSGASLGVGIQFNSERTGITFSASANKAKGQGDGSGTTWANTLVDAGQLLSITSGVDTTLQGAVAKGQQVVVNTGGQLSLQSLQDTNTYNSKSSSMGVGVTLCIPPLCTGSSSANVSLGKTRINSDFVSVAERTGIQAGDQGFQVNVAGKTDLQGAVIASTDKAVQEGKNTLNTQALSLSNIDNKAEFKAQAYSVNVGTSAGQSSAGLGKASDQAASTTTAGVSGIAGDTGVRTGDKQQGIATIFDKDKVSKDVNAQVTITAEFGKQAAKAVGDYGQSKTKPIDDANERRYLDSLAQQGPLNEAQSKRLAQLDEQGMTSSQAAANLSDPQLKQDHENWKEGGSYRVALHTAVGALAGEVGGALGAGTTAASVPTVADAIDDLKLPAPLRQAVIAVTGTVIGAAVAGSAGMVSGFNQTTNNFLVHQQVDALKKDLAKCQSKSNGCSDTDISAIVKTYHDLSNQNITKVQSCIIQGDAACVQKLESQAASAGELSGVLPLGFGSQERQLQDRQTNVIVYGSVKGPASMFGSDLDQARQVAKLRQDNCGSVSATACNDLVQQALNDRIKRVGMLMAVGTLTPVMVNGVKALRMPSTMGGDSKLSANEFNMEPDKTNAAAGKLVTSEKDIHGLGTNGGEFVAIENTISGPGRAQTRINVANGPTGTTPLRNSGSPVSAGFDHVVTGHFDVPVTNSRSVFSISPNELKGILQSEAVVSSPVTALGDGQFVRTVDVGRTIGTSTLKEGGAPTSFIKIFTDHAGNLITAFPVGGGK